MRAASKGSWTNEDVEYQALLRLHERRKPAIRLYRRDIKILALAQMTGLSYRMPRKMLKLDEQGGWSTPNLLAVDVLHRRWNDRPTPMGTAGANRANSHGIHGRRAPEVVQNSHGQQPGQSALDDFDEPFNPENRTNGSSFCGS